MIEKRIYAQIETTRFIKDKSPAEVDQMISVLNNSLEGLTFNPLEPARKMQQGSDLHSFCYIKDFHWRQKQNKGRQNKGGTLLLHCRTRVTVLSFQHKNSLDKKEYIRHLVFTDTIHTNTGFLSPLWDWLPFESEWECSLWQVYVLFPWTPITVKIHQTNVMSQPIKAL